MRHFGGKTERYQLFFLHRVKKEDPMQYSALSKPGMDDPSWYEWSVGLSYIIDMFHDDSGIDYTI